MSLPTSTMPTRNPPAHRSRWTAGAWALIAFWAILLALLLFALGALGDGQPDPAPPYEPKPWMPLFTPIAQSGAADAPRPVV